MVEFTQGIRQDWHTAMLRMKHCHQVISKNTHFHCYSALDETCSMERGRPGLVLRELIHFSRRHAAKRFLHFRPQ